MLLSFLTFRIIYPNPSQTTTAGTNTRTSSSQTATSTSTTSATATSTPIDTATSTSTATATATVTTTPGQLLYKADFAKDKDIWTAASYQLDSSGKNLICDGKAACQAEPNFTPPTANYTVTITAQLGTDDNYNQGFCVEGRINSSDISVYLQSRVHKLIFRDGDCDRYLDPQGSVVLGHEPFTESITYNNDQVTIVISQSGNPFRFSTSTKNLSNGRTRITSSTAMTILGFEIDAV